MFFLAFISHSNQGLSNTQGTQGYVGYFYILEKLILNHKKHICFEANQGGEYNKSFLLKNNITLTF